MPMVDVEKREAAELEAIKKKVLALVKSNKYAELADFSPIEGTRKHFIQVDSPLDLADDLADIVEKSPNGRVISKKNHEGSYDWASGVYFKDCSTVEFTLR